jgi:hypothetical protein
LVFCLCKGLCLYYILQEQGSALFNISVRTFQYRLYSGILLVRSWWVGHINGVG